MTKQVLLVHDTSELDELVATISQRRDCALDEVGSNREAMDQMASRSYDVVLTGVGGSPEEKLPFLEISNGHRPSRVILLTDQSSATNLTEAMRHGAFSYFSRPFLQSSLRDMMLRALEAPDTLPPIQLLSLRPDWVIMQFAPVPMTLDRVLQFLREFDPDLPSSLRENVMMACREILLNAAEHGAGFDPSKPIQLARARTQRLLMYQIRDPGPGFCLQSLTHAAVGNAPGDPLGHVLVREELGMRPGGFGMLLAQKAMDDVLYNERGNEVLLIKYL